MFWSYNPLTDYLVWNVLAPLARGLSCPIEAIRMKSP